MEIKRVIALGFFDGVHLGHGQLLRLATTRAAGMDARPCVLTFDSHPKSLVQGQTVPLINSAPDRADLIRRIYRIEEVMFLRFTQETMHMTWVEFIESLCRELGAIHFIVGFNFRFGWMGEGDANKLAHYCSEHCLGCDILPEFRLNGSEVSSTRIRTLLENGEPDRAAVLMGHPHTLTDVVRRGFNLGKTLGAATVNMQVPEGVLIPRLGVYASRLQLPEGEYPAVTNIGVRPTFGGGNAVSVESHILEYEGNLYGRRLRLDFYAFLRPERRFDSPLALKEQIERDASAAQRVLGGTT